MNRTGQTGTCAVIATIVEREVKSIDAAIEESARAGADAAEVRLDGCPGVDPGKIGVRARIPLIAACRRRRDGGSFEGEEPERVALLERAASTGRFRLDVEQGSAAEALLRTIPDRVAVLSHHDLTETSPRLEERARSLLGGIRSGQIAKLVTTARGPEDLLVLRDLLRLHRGERLAAFAMGETGRATRILSAVWGGAAVWAAARGETPGAPGQIGLETLLGLYRFRTLGPSTRLFGVAGSPIAGSLSPAIHNTAFASLGLDAVYLPLECGSAEVLERLRRELPLAGVSVTAPLKIAVLGSITEPDGSVIETRACNTIVGPRGFNTDGEAALAEIREHVEPAGRPAVVVGAGGAARAIAFALRRAGARLTISTRDRSRGTALAEELGAAHAPIQELQMPAEGVLVQATSAPIDDPVLPVRTLRALFVLDVRYRAARASSGDLEGALVIEARRRGIAAADGIGMLIRQAAAQLRLFTGREVSRELLRDAVEGARGLSTPRRA